MKHSDGIWKRAVGLAIIIVTSLAAYPTSASGPPRSVSIVSQTAPSYEFINGQWFDGAGFVSGTLFSVAGALTRKRPKHVDSVIDPKGEYVVPPYAEAHTHNISRPPTEEELKPYREQGIFYVMNQGNLIPASLEALTSPAGPIEVRYANAPPTPSGGHPVALNKRAVERGGLKLTKAELDDRAVFVVDNPTDLDRVVRDPRGQTGLCQSVSGVHRRVCEAPR
jgi:hypothetical protein